MKIFFYLNSLTSLTLLFNLSSTQLTSLPLTLSNHLYSLPVTLGTPPQTLHLRLSTLPTSLQSDFYPPVSTYLSTKSCTDCESVMSTPRSNYDPNQSSTKGKAEFGNVTRYIWSAGVNYTGSMV